MVFFLAIAESSSEENYLISNACKMLDLNPWDKSVQKFLDKPKPLICSNLPLLTFIDNSENFTYTLKINKVISLNIVGKM